jgi:pimeloyl-ACP methyl ester carboxylesterase
MKKIIALVIVIVAGYFAWQSPALGKWVYANVSDLEASIYGFEQTTVDIGEMELSAYIGGPEDKPVIVMIHGYSADKDVWPRFAKHLVDDFRIVIPDLAGHGDTGFDPKSSFRGPDQAERISKMLTALKIDKAHIIGNSMGGFITGWFARLYPDQTITATPMDPAGVASPTPSDREVMIANGNNPFFVKTREDFDIFYPMTMAKPPYLPEFILAAMAQKYQDRREELVAIDEDIGTKDRLTDELQHITAPTLIMWGNKDRLIHVSAADVWKSKIANAQVHIFDGVGHMPMVEVPAEAAAVYRQFIE